MGSAATPITKKDAFENVTALVHPDHTHYAQYFKDFVRRGSERRCPSRRRHSQFGEGTPRRGLGAATMLLKHWLQRHLECLRPYLLVSAEGWCSP